MNQPNQFEMCSDLLNEIDLTKEAEEYDGEYITKGRNSKPPKKSNHGARPCSSVMRKLKKKGWMNKLREE